MPWREEMQEALQNTGDGVGGTPFDAWPVVVPVLLAIAIVGLVVRAIALRGRKQP